MDNVFWTSVEYWPAGEYRYGTSTKAGIRTVSGYRLIAVGGCVAVYGKLSKFAPISAESLVNLCPVHCKSLEHRTKFHKILRSLAGRTTKIGMPSAAHSSHSIA